MGTAQYLSPEQAQGHAGDRGVRPLLDRRDALRDAHRQAALRRATARCRSRSSTSPSPRRRCPPACGSSRTSRRWSWARWPRTPRRAGRAPRTSPRRWRPAGPTSRRRRGRARTPARRDFARGRRGAAAVPTGDAGATRTAREGAHAGCPWSRSALLVLALIGLMAYAFTRPEKTDVPKVEGASALRRPRAARPRGLREGRGGARAQPRARSTACCARTPTPASRRPRTRRSR